MPTFGSCLTPSDRLPPGVDQVQVHHRVNRTNRRGPTVVRPLFVGEEPHHRPFSPGAPLVISCFASPICHRHKLLQSSETELCRARSDSSQTLTLIDNTTNFYDTLVLYVAPRYSTTLVLHVEYSRKKLECVVLCCNRQLLLSGPVRGPNNQQHVRT